MFTRSAKFLILLFVTCLSATINAQVTLGYTSSEHVIRSHPLYDKVTKDYKAFQEELSNKLQIQQDYLDAKMEEYQKAVEANANPTTIQELQNELTELDNQLKIDAQSAEAKLAMKSEELLEPVVTSVNDEIKSTSKKLKLNAMLETTNSEGVSFVLFAPEETDVTEYLLRGTESGQARVFATEYKLEPEQVKIGYTNVELVMMYMSEYQQMEKVLNTYAEKLTEEYKVKNEALYSLFAKYQEEETAGTLTEDSKDDYMLRLNKLDKELSGFASESEKKLGEMKSTKMAAILETLQAAIDKVASINGFTFILNQTTSSGVSSIVFGPDDCDITSALFEELMSNVEQESVDLKPKANLKVGFVNVELIMAAMPEVKTAQERITAKNQEITAKEKAASENRNQEESDAAWAIAEEKIQSYRNEQLQPIMTKIQKEINTIAEKEGYDYIINQTGGNVLYIEKKSDLNSELASGLGIKI